MTIAAPGGRRSASTSGHTLKVAGLSPDCNHDDAWHVPPNQSLGATCGTCGVWLSRWDLVDILAGTAQNLRKPKIEDAIRGASGAA